MIDLAEYRITLLSALTSRDEERIRQEKERLISENVRHGGEGLGFLVGTYSVTMSAASARKPCKPEVLPEAMELVNEIKYFQNAKRNLEAGLHNLLAPCQTPQDVRDALPDICAGELPKTLGHLPRTRPEAYTLDDKPLQKHAYAKTRELIEEFIANRIIY